MPDQLIMAMATALAVRGAQAMVTGGKTAIDALLHVVRRRFGTGTKEAEALEAAIAEPADTERHQALAEMLTRVMASDADFDEQVRSRWREVSAVLTANHEGVVNQFSGTADKVVQARDIRGDITF